jgi:hypothetical protein
MAAMVFLAVCAADTRQSWCEAGAPDDPATDPQTWMRPDAVARRDAAGRRTAGLDPYETVAEQDLLELLAALTAIRPHLGWRHSTTIGESEAIDWVLSRMDELAFLKTIGLAAQRHGFRTFTGVEFWETSVTLRRGNQEIVVPADGGPGHRDQISRAVRFDSDGVFNDRDRNPRIVDGAPLLIRSVDDIYNLTPQQLAGRIVLLDYALIDRSIMSTNEAVTRAWVLIEKRPAAIVKVTRFSNRAGESHGSFTGDVGAYTSVDVETDIPVLSLKFEDLEDLGVQEWDELLELDWGRVVWDVDLFAPGESEYLMVTIPGRDRTRSVILGAHIDSPNTPGALDDGSGSTALVEVARALDRSRTRPPVDLVLVWFGSHERGLYGSSNFTARHSDELDRAIAMLQMDCLGHPLDGIVNQIWLEGWSFESYGDAGIPWPVYLADRAGERGIGTELADLRFLVSDNSSFAGYGVPHANMIFMNPFSDLEVHYANHLHDPYDDMDRARLEGGAFRDMATIMLAAALETGADDPLLRTQPTPDRRALFVGSHTEGIHMSPSGLSEFGMALAWNGFDVDMVPYGRSLTPADLSATDLVVALPVHDYPTPEVDTTLYDEAWTDTEIDLLDDFVARGGVLVLTNTDRRLKYVNLAYDHNEDWQDVNVLADRFGVRYTSSLVDGSLVLVSGDHPIVDGVVMVRCIAENGHTFQIDAGTVLARADDRPAIAVVPHGSGHVVVLADLGMLGAIQDPPRNQRFFENLAQFAR